MVDLVTNILCDGQHKTFYIIASGQFSEAKSCVVSMKYSNLKYMYGMGMTTHSLELRQKFTIAVI